MQKLLVAYRADPTLQNARKLRAYLERHPMAACFLSAVDIALLDGHRE